MSPAAIPLWFDPDLLYFCIVKHITDIDLRARVAGLSRDNRRNCVSIDGYLPAGVLVPIILGTGTPSLLFTKRTEFVETHKGQVSFPGGVMDPGDGDIVHTALREAWEEIGLPDTAIRVVGLLDDLPTPTGFIITPVVGILETLPALTPNSAEVADVFQVPLSFFADPGNGRTEIREFLGRQHDVWYFQSGGHTIWGATAMIVQMLLKRFDLVKDKDNR